MTPLMLTLMIFAIMLVLMAIRVPIAIAMFVAGATYTMADICALSTVDFAEWIGLSIPDGLPNVIDEAGRCGFLKRSGRLDGPR